MYIAIGILIRRIVMKATKRIVCLTLALIMAGLAFIMPVSAAEEAAIPFVMINGIGSTKLYKNIGEAPSDTSEGEKLVFSDDDAFIEGMIKDIGGALLSGIISYGIGDKDYDALADKVFPVANKYLEDIGYNPDGTPRNATVGFKQNTNPMSDYTDEEKADLSPFALKYAEVNGEENVYNFSYDWREDPVAIADQLNAFIKTIAGAEGQVNLVAMSMGSTIALAYMDKYGGKQLNNVVFASPAWQGTGLIGDTFTGNIEVDVFAVENFLVQLANVSATTHITAFIISFIASWDGLSREYFGDINEAVQGILPRSYTDTVIPYLAGMPGLWSLCPYSDFENAKKFIFKNREGVELTPEFEAKINAYHDIQGRAQAIVQKAIDDGMNFYIVAGYNCQMIPVNMKYKQSDTIIEVEYMTGGATCALYLQSGNDWGKIATQKIEDGHRHVSWDGKIDLSTAMFPEQTWLIKNLQHNGYNSENGSLDLVMWLLGSEKQLTVTSDMQNYPQFMLYNTYTKTTRPVALEALMGDVNSSGAVRTDDAYDGLKISAGLKKPTDTQMAVGDLDEDGKITTTDVKTILSIAAGIQVY